MKWFLTASMFQVRLKLIERSFTVQATRKEMPDPAVAPLSAVGQKLGAAVAAFAPGVFAMVPSKLQIMAALVAGTGLLASSGPFADRVRADEAPPAARTPKEPKARTLDKAPRASKFDLTPESFPKLQALVRPRDHEWRHLRVHWLTDPVAALKKAAVEDKPIVFLYLGGAGYNAPLGVC